MAKLDRLGWAAGTCFDAYGVRIGVRTNKEEALLRLPEHLPPSWKPATSPAVDHLYSFRVGERPRRGVQNYHLLYSGISQVARTMDLAQLYETLEADLRQRVAADAKRGIFVHAGVVAWRGRAIMIPGHSGSGKTTLVAELLRAGAHYYSDEFAVVDERGRVHPFAKPLSLRDGGWDEVRKETPEALGGVRGEKPLPLGLVAFAPYRRGARWRPAPLTPGQCLLALLAHTVPVRRRPEASLSALQRAISGALMLKGARGEAEETVPSLLDRLN